MDGKRLGELDPLEGLPWRRFFGSFLQLGILLRVAFLNVLKQVGLLHVKEGALRASKDLGRHLHSMTLRLGEKKNSQ